jgi:hypothetical protein
MLLSILEIDSILLGKKKYTKLPSSLHKPSQDPLIQVNALTDTDALQPEKGQGLPGGAWHVVQRGRSLCLAFVDLDPIKVVPQLLLPDFPYRNLLYFVARVRRRPYPLPTTMPKQTTPFELPGWNLPLTHKPKVRISNIFLKNRD